MCENQREKGGHTMRFRTRPFAIEWHEDGPEPCEQWLERYVWAKRTRARYFFFEVSDEKLPGASEVIYLGEDGLLMDERSLGSGWRWQSALLALLQIGKRYWVRVHPSDQGEHMLPLGVWQSPYMRGLFTLLRRDLESVQNDSLWINGKLIEEMFSVKLSWPMIYQLEITNQPVDDGWPIALTHRETKLELLEPTPRDAGGLIRAAKHLLRPDEPYWLSLWVYE